MPQTYPVCYGEEFSLYIAPDGTEYVFHAPPTRFEFSEEGFGMPPIEYVSTVGPFQDGETLRDFFLKPRIVQLLIRNNSPNRRAYITQRAQLLNAIRPNRQTVDTNRLPGRLRKILPDGTIRDLDCLIEQGPGFQARKIDQWDEWSFQEVLRFIAHNPVLYNPIQQTLTIGWTPAPLTDGLIFPITFPITFSGFGGGSGLVTTTLQYNGTWQEFPTIEIHGPATAPQIDNLTTGEHLQLNTSLAVGEIVTFNLSYSNKSVTRNDGANMIGFLTSDSDIGTFHLTTVNNGANSMQVFTSGAAYSTKFVFKWFERYIGR